MLTIIVLFLFLYFKFLYQNNTINNTIKYLKQYFFVKCIFKIVIRKITSILDLLLVKVYILKILVTLNFE